MASATGPGSGSAANNVTPINAAIQNVVNVDSELAEAARSLAHLAIKQALYYLQHGSPKVQLDVIKSIMPAIGRGMSDKGESDEIMDMRRELGELMAQVTGINSVG